jgi:hypothetical protein
MVIDYFNGCTLARSIVTAAKIKIMGEPSLVFQVSGSALFGCLLKNASKKKELKDLKNLLISFRLYFLVVGDSLCISTMYYLLL